MKISTITLALALSTVAGLALAQESGGTSAGTTATTEQGQQSTAEGSLSMGTVEGEGQVGQTYVAETFDDWQLTCVKTQDGKDPCQLYQLLKDGDGNSVAEVNIIALPDGGEAVAGATIVTPLETLLTENLRLGVDGGKTKVYPFTFCAAVGCVARVGFTAAEVDAFKNGAKATLTIVPVAAPDKTVALNMSLKGFTAAWEAVKAKNLAPKE